MTCRAALAARRRRRDLSGRHDRATAAGCCHFKARCCSRSIDAQGHVQPMAIRYRDGGWRASDARRLTSATPVPGLVLARAGRARASSCDSTSRRRCPHTAGTGAHLAREAEAAIRTALGVDRRATRHLVHAPVGQPERRERSRPTGSPSRASARSASSIRSSVDQWPQSTVTAADLRSGCVEPRVRIPRACGPAPRFSPNSIVSSAAQKRRRVQALTIARRRS